MITTELQVYNLALSAIGTRSSITSGTDGREGELCSLWYPQVRDQVLKAAPWSSARASSRLSVQAERDTDEDWVTGDPEATYAFAYNLPSDFLYPRHLATYQRFQLGVLNNVRVLFSNEEDTILIYTKQETRPHLWDHDLAMAIVWGLAAAICVPLNGKSSRMKEMLALADDAILKAKVMEANADHWEAEAMPEWLTARGAANPGYPNRYVFPAGPALSTAFV